LIALDIQRVVEDASARKTVFARNFREVQALEGRFHEFDLAIVTPPRYGTADWSVADKLIAAVPALVVCSAARVITTGTSFANAEIVYKPFADEQLLAACRRALDKRSAASSAS
jgi:hypothetical protein